MIKPGSIDRPKANNQHAEHFSDNKEPNPNPDSGPSSMKKSFRTTPPDKKLAQGDEQFAQFAAAEARAPAGSQALHTETFSENKKTLQKQSQSGLETPVIATEKAPKQKSIVPPVPGVALSTPSSNISHQRLQNAYRFAETQRGVAADQRLDMFIGRQHNLADATPLPVELSAKAIGLKPEVAFPHFARMTTAIARFTDQVVATKGKTRVGHFLEQSSVAAAYLIRARAELGLFGQAKRPFGDVDEFGSQNLRVTRAWCRSMGIEGLEIYASGDKPKKPIDLRGILPAEKYGSDVGVYGLIYNIMTRHGDCISNWNVHSTAAEDPFVQGAVFALPMRAILDVAKFSGTPSTEIRQFAEQVLLAFVQLPESDASRIFPSRYGSDCDSKVRHEFLSGLAAVLHAGPVAAIL